jgi:hypothetical protein
MFLLMPLEYKECSCGCGEIDKPEDFFTCDICAEELHDSHLMDNETCDRCHEEHESSMRQ